MNEEKKIISVGDNEGNIVPVTYEDGNTGIYRLFCGSVAWLKPEKDEQGVILLAGEKLLRQTPKETIIIVHEEKEFSGLNQVEEIFSELEFYKPFVYWTNKRQESHPFIDHFFSLYWPLDNQGYSTDPFIQPIPNTANTSHGLALIRNYLAERKLFFRDGELFQRDKDNPEAPVIKALQYLVIGMQNMTDTGTEEEEPAGVSKGGYFGGLY